MSLSTTTNRSDRTLNGVATVFAFDFKVFAETDLEVIHIDQTTEVETVLTLGVDYTVSGVNADAGSVTLVAGPGTSGDRLIIKRVMNLVQPTRLRNQGDFFPATHERAFDRSIMIDQQQQEEIDRSFKLSPSATAGSVEAPSAEPGYALGWDALGNLVNVPNTGADQTAAWTAADAIVAGNAVAKVDLASTSDAAKGANLVGFDHANTYGAGTIGKWLTDLATSVGSGFLGFIQAGTGAVLRTVQSKLREKIFVEDYGAVGDGVTDDHDAIMAAVTAAAGEPVWFRSKTYATSPLVFNGFNGVDLRGWGGWVPRVTVPKLLAIGTTGTLLQFAEDADTSPAWLCKEARVSNLFLDGGGAVDGNGKWVSGGMAQAIIYCQGAILKNVTVRHFSGTGIIQGDMCVDFDGLLDTVNSSFNGGHGLQINPTQSTVMRFQNCSFSGNRLRGINIMGGKSVVWNNVGAQSNDAGGILIHNSIAGSVQIQRHSFTEVYTEANGGPALEISSADAGANNNCPNFMDFKSCAFNPLAGQAAVNISRCYGVSFDNGILDPYTLGTTIIIGTGAKAIQNWGGHFYPTSTSSDDTTHMTNFRHLAGTQKGIEVQGAWFPSRGRLRCLEFWVNDQAANTVALMETIVPAAFTSPAKGYQMFGPGSIVGITIKKGPLGGGATGTISVRPLYLAAGSGLATAPTNPISGAPVLTMDVATTVNAKVEYTMDTKRITDTAAILGMELTTPVGYVAGTNKHILVQLWIEE